MTLTPHNPQELFDDVEEAQMDDVAYMRSHIKGEPCQFEVAVRDIADHPLCFVPGCDEPRHESVYSKYHDRRLITCVVHKEDHSEVNRAMYAKRRWMRGEGE